MNNKVAILLFLLIAVGGGVAVLVLQPSARRVTRTSDRPNVLLISLDTTRADHLGCYGYARDTSPTLDALAAEGLLYTRCESTSSWTLPAHASMLTGMYPTTHGAVYDPKGKIDLTGILPGEWSAYRVNALSEEVVTLTDLLAENGYATGGFVGGPWLKRPFGLAQGFAEYDDDQIIDVNGRLAEQINERVFAWLDKVAAKPFFLFINYFDPHDPYLPPEAFRYRFLDESKLIDGAKATPEQLVALYDAEIYYTDFHIAALLNRLRQYGIYDDTWIIVTADHGELFGEHGLRGHGATLYEEELHVPLIMKYPKRTPKLGRSDELIQVTDIMPIVLDQLGLSIPPGVQGSSGSPQRRYAFAEVYPLPALSKRGSFRAFYDGPLKYIWNSRGHHEFYDLANDPDESKNLYRSRYEQASAVRDKLDALMKGLPRPDQAAPVRRIDKDTMKALRDLGYVGGTSATTPTRPSSKPATQEK